MDRRNFISLFGISLLASSLPAVLAACATSESSSSSDSPKQSKAADGFKTVGAIAQLDKEGKLSSDGILVVRNPKDTELLLAVNPTCPHKGCVVEWHRDSKEFVCPCHDSKFTVTGTVTHGPAQQPLKILAAKIEKGQVLVKSSA
jgi:cytochrome b6-f complex iron-sulfur subunit